MKKFILSVLAIMLAAFMLAGCENINESSVADTSMQEDMTDTSMTDENSGEITSGTENTDYLSSNIDSALE